MSTDLAQLFASSADIDEGLGESVRSLGCTKTTSSLMGSKAALERHSSMTGVFFEMFFTTRRMLVWTVRVPFSMLVGTHPLSMASMASGRLFWARRSRASCQRASASDSREISMGTAIVLLKNSGA